MCECVVLAVVIIVLRVCSCLWSSVALDRLYFETTRMAMGRKPSLACCRRRLEEVEYRADRIAMKFPRWSRRIVLSRPRIDRLRRRIDQWEADELVQDLLCGTPNFELLRARLRLLRCRGARCDADPQFFAGVAEAPVPAVAMVKVG